MQSEMHTAEQSVPQHSASDFEVSVGKPKVINLQVFMRFQKSCFKEGEKHSVLIFLNLLG
jgi:hypothetical protein